MTYDFILRLAAAFACGVAIGIERQLRQRNAGLRTITLVTSGACLFVTLGAMVGTGTAGTTQIAAYVVSGIGFLGGGVIMRDKGAIQGINTAATLWCSGAVGTLCGAGLFPEAVAGTTVILLTNTLLRALSRTINNASVSSYDAMRQYILVVICRESDELHMRAVLSNLMEAAPLSFNGLTSREVEASTPSVEVTATLSLHPKDQARLEKVASRISMEVGVSSVSWSGLETQLAPE